MSSILFGYSQNRLLREIILEGDGGGSFPLPPPKIPPQSSGGGGSSSPTSPSIPPLPPPSPPSPPSPQSPSSPSSGSSLGDSYTELLKTLEEINKKYSTDYQPPKVDLPLSLGGEKITYIMPAQEELESQARQGLQSGYISSRSSAEQRLQRGADSIANSVTKAQYEAMLKRLKAEQAFPQEKEAAQNKALEQGLARSSIASGLQEKARQEYDGAIEGIDRAEGVDKTLFAQQLQQLREQTESALKAISNIYDAQVTEKVAKLLSDAYKQKQDALEYNNSLEAAENRYQVTRQNALTAAEKEERQRLADVLKMYEQLGKSGVQQKAQLEKFLHAKVFFDTLSAQDAKELLNASASLQYYLGDYYAALCDYVKNR